MSQVPALVQAGLYLVWRSCEPLKSCTGGVSSFSRLSAKVGGVVLDREVSRSQLLTFQADGDLCL